MKMGAVGFTSRQRGEELVEPWDGSVCSAIIGNDSSNFEGLEWKFQGKKK